MYRIVRFHQPRALALAFEWEGDEDGVGGREVPVGFFGSGVGVEGEGDGGGEAGDGVAGSGCGGEGRVVGFEEGNEEGGGPAGAED